MVTLNSNHGLCRVRHGLFQPWRIGLKSWKWRVAGTWQPHLVPCATENVKSISIPTPMAPQSEKKTLQISTAPHYALNIHHVIKSYNLLQSSTNQRKHHHCFSISKKKLRSTTSQTTSQHLLSKLNRLSCWYCQGARLRTSYFTICFGGAHPARVIRFGSPTRRPLRSKPRQTPARDFRQMALLVLKRRSRWPKQIRSHCKISAASIRSHY